MSDAPAVAVTDEEGPGDGRRLDARHLIGLFVVLTVVNVGAGAASETLVPSIFGVLLAPVVIGTSLWFAVASALHLRARRWVQGGAPLALLLALTGAVLSGALGRRFMFPGSHKNLPATGQVDAFATVIEYASDDGIALRGLFVRGDAPAPRPALVHFHGNRSSAASNEHFARALAARGVDVLLAEYRGYGDCPGRPSEEGLLRDARAAVRELSARTGVAPRDLVIFGQSLGTGVASAMAAEGVGRSVVLLSPYTGMLDLVSDMVSRPLALLAVRDTFDSRARLLGATQPVLIFHGTNDHTIPFRHGEALAGAIGPRARFVRLDGCDHNDVFKLAGDRVIAEVLAVARLP